MREERERAPLRLTAVLPQLSDKERRIAAIHLISLDTKQQTEFTLAVLENFHHLHALSKPKVLEAILATEQFQQKAVQVACVSAVRSGLNGKTQADMLRKISMHPAFNEELAARL